jgi:branched-chain amino acid transport system permease protein
VRPSANQAGLLAATAAALVLLVVPPLAFEVFTLVNATIYLIMATLALSLALVWGFGGILCLGQSMFYGLGAYAYAVTVLNTGESTLPILLGVALPVAFAAVLGYFMFWGRVSDVYLAVITLTVSLILFHLINSTAGDQYRIGEALLGGYNGLPGLPPINWPGDPDRPISFEGMYLLAAAVLVATYFGLRWLLHSHFGRVTVAIRENEARAGLLGYDVHRHKLWVLMIGAGIAGLAGVLSVSWGSFVGPNVFSIVFTAQIIVWILVGGLGTLIGPIVGAVAIQFLIAWLGEAKIADTNLVLGALFVLFVLLVPKGLVPMLAERLRPWAARRFPELAEPGSGDPL